MKAINYQTTFILLTYESYLHNKITVKLYVCACVLDVVVNVF